MEGCSLTNPRLLLLLTILFAVGTLVTYATVMLPPTLMSVNPGGTGQSDYGFPIAWKDDVVQYCAPFHPQACPSPIYNTNYNWFGFVADVLFYVLVGYGFFLLYRRYHLRKTNP
jgi:hypothetical protein